MKTLLKAVTFIGCFALTTCAALTFGYTDPETGITVDGTYSSKGGLTGALTVEPTK